MGLLRWAQMRRQVPAYAPTPALLAASVSPDAPRVGSAATHQHQHQHQQRVVTAQPDQQPLDRGWPWPPMTQRWPPSRPPGGARSLQGTCNSAGVGPWATRCTRRFAGRQVTQSAHLSPCATSTHPHNRSLTRTHRVLLCTMHRAPRTTKPARPACAAFACGLPVAVVAPQPLLHPLVLRNVRIGRGIIMAPHCTA